MLAFWYKIKQYYANSCKVGMAAYSGSIAETAYSGNSCSLPSFILVIMQTTTPPPPPWGGGGVLSTNVNTGMYH